MKLCHWNHNCIIITPEWKNVGINFIIILAEVYFKYLLTENIVI